jgi:hypothetical protein
VGFCRSIPESLAEVLCGRSREDVRISNDLRALQVIAGAHLNIDGGDPIQEKLLVHNYDIRGTSRLFRPDTG